MCIHDARERACTHACTHTQGKGCEQSDVVNHRIHAPQSRREHVGP